MPRLALLSSIGALLLLGSDVAIAASSPIVPPATLASMYMLTTSTTLTAPTSTMSPSDATSYLMSNWGLSGGKLQNGGSNLAFVDDPFPDDSTSSSADSASNSTSVLRVTYPAGSYSHDTGGAQFYALFGNSSNSSSRGENWESMLLTYEVAFDADFDWVKGGKLPGLRGGQDEYGCSGGRAANGTNCFSSRMMWRTDGDGEGAYSLEFGSVRGDESSWLVYAYVVESKGFCDTPTLMCNDDGYGTSIDRGVFDFEAGA